MELVIGITNYSPKSHQPPAENAIKMKVALFDLVKMLFRALMEEVGENGSKSAFMVVFSEELGKN